MHHKKKHLYGIVVLASARRIQVFDSEGKFLRIITVDVPFDENARPAIGNKPDLKTYQRVQTFVPGACSASQNVR